MAGEMEVSIETESCDGCGEALKGKFQTDSICGSVDLRPQCSPAQGDPLGAREVAARQCATAGAQGADASNAACGEAAASLTRPRCAA
eukprot:15467705-Alexandrium_andersonii.AAC.1